MSELESESRQPRDGVQVPLRSYKVKMDLEGFRDLFGAQNGLYMRKIAVMLLVCDLPFTIALLWGGAYAVSLELSLPSSCWSGPPSACARVAATCVTGSCATA